MVVSSMLNHEHGEITPYTRDLNRSIDCTPHDLDEHRQDFTDWMQVHATQ